MAEKGIEERHSRSEIRKMEDKFTSRCVERAVEGTETLPVGSDIYNN
jgi:hypothetical protein